MFFILGATLSSKNKPRGHTHRVCVPFFLITAQKNDFEIFFPRGHHTLKTPEGLSCTWTAGNALPPRMRILQVTSLPSSNPLDFF